ncbi:YdeI/OmpD-associated family protein [Microbacterium sp. 179-B 1A2 NHS]|uniref:YdeI/OmpD-associated family protein n=1 Tax=Microbacterium sp. 179-B 1A2 NHS TaxID=3142383 RepID=UPI0039A3EA5A
MSITVHTALPANGPGTAIELTDAQVDALAGGRRAAVVVTIGDRSARLRLSVMGGRNLIGMSKAARAELGVDIGDEVDAIIDLDTAERAVDVPADLVGALDAEPQVRAAFDALPPSRRKELARQVAEAKKPETRERRVATIIDGLRPGPVS